MKKCVFHHYTIFPVSFFLSLFLSLFLSILLTINSPNVEFCGYSIPHPSEPKMNIRIQTYEGTAFEALAKGFDDLADLCDVVLEKFSEEREAYGQQ
jgi:DNA-directed RNA polymerase subunit L